MAPVVVEEVVGGKALARFVELPQAVHGDDLRFAPLVLTWERYRVDRHRNPYFDRADVQLFLARRAGRPVGRIAAHLRAGGSGDGRFGFWATVEDEAVALALLDAARGWLAGRGCTAARGPLSFEPDDELGALTAGTDVPGTTGRPWRPAFEAALLEQAGAEVAGEARTWRLPAADLGVELPTAGPAPGQAGPHGDPRLVLEGVAAVPDLSPHLRTSRIRGAWGLARRVRAGDWEGCTVVRCEDDPASRVPAIVTAAARAGYAWVVAPWSPDPAAPPETVHRTYRLAC